MWNKMIFQDSNSPLMEHISFFHDHSMLAVLSILAMVMFFTKTYVKSVYFNSNMSESQETEMFWTTFPALILMFISIPSLKTLYLMEENLQPILTIKALGYQWYWSYEYSNLISKKITSLMSSSDKVRLESPSYNLLIPTLTPTRMIISSKDVLHSWAMPSMGVKMDAVPGRMNQTMLVVKRPGIMLGQCSEICGTGHSFMPIMVQSPSTKTLISSL